MKVLKVWLLVSQTFNFLFYGYNIRWIAYLERKMLCLVRL